MNMYGLAIGGFFNEAKAAFYNKGADPDEPTKILRIQKQDWHDCHTYFDTERKALDPYGRDYAHFAALARRLEDNPDDAGAEAELRTAPVFIIEGGSRITCANLIKTHLKPIFDAAGIRANLHMLRHEMVHNRMREIEALPDSFAIKERRRERLAKDMGWSSTDMIRVYDAYEEERRRLEEQGRYQDTLMSELTATLIGGSGKTLPVPNPSDELSEHQRAILEPSSVFTQPRRQTAATRRIVREAA